MPATRDGVATLPFRRGGCFFRPLHGPAFRAAVHKGYFLHDFKPRRNEFQAFYGFLCDNLVFRIAVRTVTVCSRQFVLNDFGCLKGGKVFLLFAGTFLSFCKKTDGPLPGPVPGHSDLLPALPH